MRFSPLITVLSAISVNLSSATTIYEIGQSDEDFSTLVSLVEAAGLAETLSSEDKLTLFAPPNEAFAALDEDVIDWLGENMDALTSVLLYHVVAGKFLSSDLVFGNLTTVEGSNVTVSLNPSPMINDANIIEADTKASNGVIHVIDGVLIPQSVINKYVASLEPMKSTKKCKGKKDSKKSDSKKYDSKHDKKAKKDDSKKSKKHDKKSKRS